MSSQCFIRQHANYVTRNYDHLGHYRSSQSGDHSVKHLTASLAYWSRDTNEIQISPIVRQRKTTDRKDNFAEFISKYLSSFTVVSLLIFEHRPVLSSHV